MSFRVKNYRSRLDWQIGKGGFGTVYAGVFSPKNGSDSEQSVASGNSRDSQPGETLDRPLSEQVAIKLEKSDHERPCLANEARALKALQGAEGIPKFHVFAHTKITVKCRPGAQRTPIDAMPPPGAGSGGGAGVHGKRSPTAYKRSPLSTPVHSAFETPIGSEWSYGYGELQRQQQLPPLAHFYQPEQATPHHYPQPHAANLLSPSRPSTPSVSVAVVETTYNALVMERLGEDVGTIFRRHLLKHVKPSAVPTLSGDGTASSFNSTRRRPSACDTAAAGVRGRERVGWDEETIAWLGCHALKRLEWVHSQGLVHRDIPENFCIGLGKKKDILYIVDFGMAQPFRTSNGQHMPRSGEGKGCVGTQAFMSYRCEGTRRDDIESLGYLLLFLYNGNLPWSKHADRFEESFARSGHRWTAESVGLNEQIAMDKRELIRSRKWLEGVPRELQVFFDHVAALGFADRPDYSALRVLLRRMKPNTAAVRGVVKGEPRCQEQGKDRSRRVIGTRRTTGAEPATAAAVVNPDTCKFPLGGGGGGGGGRHHRHHSCSRARHIPVV